MTQKILIAVFAGLMTSACGESASELYFRGIQIEGEASRGDCKLLYDQDVNAYMLDGDQVLSCLRRTEEALDLYEKATAMGGRRSTNFVESRDRAKARKQKLESMLRVIREIEFDNHAASY